MLKPLVALAIAAASFTAVSSLSASRALACTPSGSNDQGAVIAKVGCDTPTATTVPPADTSGGPVCTPWAPFLGDSVYLVAAPITRIAADGSLETSSIRECVPGGKQYRWISSPTPRSVAGQAFGDMKRQGLPKPTAKTGPPLDKMIVNFETWIAVQPENPVTAEATAGGVTSTVTATPVRIEFQTGTISAKDVAVVACDPWGSIDFGICTWTPQFPSIPQATGTDDLTYHGSISIIWNVAWTSNTGAGGNLGQLTSTTPLNITVMEIQTIGSG